MWSWFCLNGFKLLSLSPAPSLASLSQGVPLERWWGVQLNEKVTVRFPRELRSIVHPQKYNVDLAVRTGSSHAYCSGTTSPGSSTLGNQQWVCGGGFLDWPTAPPLSLGLAHREVCFSFEVS